MAVLCYRTESLQDYKTIVSRCVYNCMLLIGRYSADCGTRVCIIQTHDLTMTNQYMNVLTESV